MTHEEIYRWRRYFIQKYANRFEWSLILIIPLELIIMLNIRPIVLTIKEAYIIGSLFFLFVVIILTSIIYLLGLSIIDTRITQRMRNRYTHFIFPYEIKRKP